MGTTSIWFTVGHCYTAMCPIPIQASTPEIVGRGVPVLRLLEGSLGEAEVIGGIATWSYVYGQPRRLSLLRLLALSMLLLYNVPLSEGGDTGQFVSHLQ